MLSSQKTNQFIVKGILFKRILLLIALQVTVCLFFLPAVWATISLKGSTGNPYYVPKATSEIRVDGDLEEEVWKQALVIELPYEVLPGENVLAPVQTECLLSYDTGKLYIGFRAFDPSPGAIRAYYKDRDTILGDDCVGVTIDTFNDERRAYDFFSSPFGVQFDAIDSDNGTDTSWDAIWTSAGKIYDWGYSVEMAIPFSQLRFQRMTNGDPQIWGFDADRRYPREYTYVLGSFPRDRNNNCYLCQLLKIEGFEGVQPGHNVELSPTLTAVRTDERSEFPEGKLTAGDSDVEGGLNAQWGITPNITFNATLNPDFSQVEADSLQLDINEPFALYYSEKRPFFIEGKEYFKTPFDAVYTRSIYAPSWGLKLTGKEDDNTIGLYIVEDEFTNYVFPGNQGTYAYSDQSESVATVLRYQRDFGTNYTLGALVTDREGEDYFNRVFGVDGSFRFSQNDYVFVQVLGSSTQYPDEIAFEFNQKQEQMDDRAFILEYEHSTRTIDWRLQYEDAGPDFRADLGFIPRVDYRGAEGGLSYSWIGQPGGWWSELTLGNDLVYYEDHEGQPLYENLELYFNFQGRLQSSLNILTNRAKEHYEQHEFEVNDFYFSGNFKPIGNLWFMIDTSFGDRIDYANVRLGKRTFLRPALHFNWGKHLGLDLSHAYEYMSVDQGRLYIAHISQTTVVYQFNQRAFLRAILQYVDYDRNIGLYSEDIDPKFEKLFSQYLFSYTLNPRTVLFLGYSDNSYGSTDYELTQSERTFFAKIGYAWEM